MRVSGFDGWQDWLESNEPYPLVLFGNHETWWDGLLDFSLGEHFQMDSRLMMEEKNLRLYRFFQGCGCFGVDLESQRGRGESLLHAVRLLSEDDASRRCLILYPHGRLVPDWETPRPAFAGGLERVLARAPGATAVPVWRKLTFGKHELPEVDIHLGPPILADVPRDTAALSSALDSTRHMLHERLNRGTLGDVLYLSRRRSLLLGET